MKLKDIRKDNGLCPRCGKYSTPKWERLRKAVQLILVKYDARRQTYITEIDEYGIHLKRGGRFYHQQQRKTICIHQFTLYAFSYPNDDDLYDKCDHQHTESDKWSQNMAKKLSSWFFHTINFWLTKNLLFRITPQRDFWHTKSSIFVKEKAWFCIHMGRQKL